MTTSPLISARHGAVLALQMNQLDNRNAISAEMKVALAEEAQRFCADATLRCLLLTGTGDTFCAGGDLRNMTTDCSTVGTRERMALTHQAFQLLVAAEKPVIMAVNGAAVGGGLSLAMIGDMVIASQDAYFMAGFPKVGVLPDVGVLYNLPRAVGMVQAKDILLTNRRIDADEAKAIGLVSRVLPQAGFFEAALALATQVAQGPSVSMGLAKALMNGGYKDSFPEFLLKESMAQAVVFGTQDFQEGNAAFREKRKPRFVGR